MTTTMYLSNAKEIAAAARAAKQLGYQTSNADIKANDRYVTNIVARLAGGDLSEARKLEAAIVQQVGWIRNDD